MFFPRALSSLTDAQNAIERLTEVFEAETMASAHTIDPQLDAAVKVSAKFNWGLEKTGFGLELDLVVPKGQIVGIVGPVGSGKSSLLQGVSPV
jgi:ABC-type bacteriocin/lantibiotic exporter with double-glycine peptidase domain